jgi:hypothetical protein
MESLTKDVLFNIATMLDLDNLLSFCNSDPRINQLICQGEVIWNFKLAKEFPDYKSHINQRGREAYELLVGLSKLKIWSKYKGTIYELYKETKLDLSRKGLTTLPPEIGKLSQLRELYLYNNQITILPPEIGNLSRLQVLYLLHNQIKIVPPEIGNLNQLHELSLRNNQITTLPPEIGNLKKLRELWLDKNVIVPPGLRLPIVYF